MTAPRVALLAAAVALVVSATDRSYCEAPHPLAVVPDPVTSKLLQVVVLSRHGDRSPLTALPHEHNESNIAWDCTLQVPVRSFAATSNTQAGTTFATHFRRAQIKHIAQRDTFCVAGAGACSL